MGVHSPVAAMYNRDPTAPTPVHVPPQTLYLHSQKSLDFILTGSRTATTDVSLHWR